jgi:hypothetical protein
MSMEEKIICVHCGSDLTVRLACETHCNACGKSFALDKNPIVTIAANRRAAAGPSTGFPVQHGNAELSSLEQAVNRAERELSDAVLNVCRHRERDAELLRLRQVERDAKQNLDRLLATRGELATQRSRPWPRR